jgi:hypothetical protein
MSKWKCLIMRLSVLNRNIIHDYNRFSSKHLLFSQRRHYSKEQQQQNSNKNDNDFKGFIDKDEQAKNDLEKKAIMEKIQAQRSVLSRFLRLKDMSDFVFLILFSVFGYFLYKKWQETKKIEEEYEFLEISEFKHKFIKVEDFHFPEYLAKHLKNLKQFEVRNDDIWVISFPKSGTFLY